MTTEVRLNSRRLKTVGFFLMPIALEEITQVLVSLGCPADRGAEMAAQLDKRARQLAEAKGRTYEEAVAHLLRLMAGGWAAPTSTPAA